MDLNDPATMKSISKIMAQPSLSQPLKNLYRGEPMALGITQIGIGIMEILFGLAILMTETSHSYEEAIAHIRTPYWTGIPYIISGSLSVVVAKKPEVPLTIVVFQNTEQGTPPAVLAPVKGYEVL